VTDGTCTGGAFFTGPGWRRNISTGGGIPATNSTGGGVARTISRQGGLPGTSSTGGGTPRTNRIGGIGLPSTHFGLPTSARNRVGEGIVYVFGQQPSQGEAHFSQRRCRRASNIDMLP
jgi:hypothetical protein